MQAPSYSNKRTNVRPAPLAIRAAFRVLAPLPFASSELAARLWATPPRAPLRSDQQTWLKAAERMHFDAAGTRIAGYAWGSGKAVLLVHGWGGHAGQLTSFVPALVEAGYRAVAFDAPRHGATSGGTPTIPSFAAAARALSSKVGGFEALIAHSMGATAMAYAMRYGLSLERAIFLAPAATMTGAAERFARMVGLGPRGLEGMRRKFEKRIGVEWEEFDVLREASRARSPLLVMHDTGDRDVPYEDGLSIVGAWPSATLATTDGLGHHRLLRDPGVIRRALAFIQEGGIAATPWSA